MKTPWLLPAVAIFQFDPNNYTVGEGVAGGMQVGKVWKTVTLYLYRDLLIGNMLITTAFFNDACTGKHSHPFHSFLGLMLISVDQFLLW